MPKCPICCRPLDAPWRRYDATGRVIEGCVARAHDGRLITPSSSADWQRRGRLALGRRRK
jgi:hypothetical protein